MYKNYEDKLNTILSNAKGEKVEKVEFNTLKEIEVRAKQFEAFLRKNKSILREAQKAKTTLKEAAKINKNGYELHNKQISGFRDFILNAKKLGFEPTKMPEVKQYFKASEELEQFNRNLLSEIPRRFE
jgi:hypothetical protein